MYKRRKTTRGASGIGLLAILPFVFMALAISVWRPSLELKADGMTSSESEKKTFSQPDVLASSSEDSWRGYFIYLPKSEYLPAEIISGRW
ncbi:MAG: hypothetical protein LBS53_12025 [Synergistaceae bacterium]|jgi:hypothetical protein|nr:hypothetical protein [Synergistaceae bacterium]